MDLQGENRILVKEGLCRLKNTKNQGLQELIRANSLEAKQREQSREHSSLKERLEENKRIVAERERENAYRKGHDRGMSR